MNININEYVKVKLTEVGKDIYYHQFDELNAQCGKVVIKPSMPKVDEDGYTEFQLWQLIELYGPHLHMGCPLPFEPNIEYAQKIDKE